MATCKTKKRQKDLREPKEKVSVSMETTVLLAAKSRASQEGRSFSNWLNHRLKTEMEGEEE